MTTICYIYYLFILKLCRHLFYLDLKKKLRDESVKIPNYRQKIKILSCLAQAELGDYQPDCDLEILYRTVVPCYTGKYSYIGT